MFGRCLSFSAGARGRGGAFGGAALQLFGSAESPFQAALAWSSYVFGPAASSCATPGFFLPVAQACLEVMRQPSRIGTLLRKRGGISAVKGVGGGCPCAQSTGRFSSPSRTSAVRTEQFNPTVLLALGGCGCPEKQPGRLGSGAGGGGRGGDGVLLLSVPGFSGHFINTLIESEAAAG